MSTKPRPGIKVSTRAARAAFKRNKTARSGKYNAKGLKIDGHWFASASEGIRYQQLKRLVEAGRIERLELQPIYQLVVNGQHIADYRGDFRYAVLDESGRVSYLVLEDVKGMVTDVYLLKKKLVEALHGIDVNEIPARKVTSWEGRTP